MQSQRFQIAAHHFELLLWSSNMNAITCTTSGFKVLNISAVTNSNHFLGSSSESDPQEAGRKFSKALDKAGQWQGVIEHLEHREGLQLEAWPPRVLDKPLIEAKLGGKNPGRSQDSPATCSACFKDVISYSVALEACEPWENQMIGCCSWWDLINMVYIKQHQGVLIVASIC